MGEENLGKPAPKGKSASAKKPKNAGVSSRRESRRIVHSKCLVQLGVLQEDQLIDGFAVDISSLGIGLITEAFVRSGKKLRLSIYTNDFTFEFEATVAWCRELPSTKRIIKKRPKLTWRMGLEFLPKDNQEKDILKNLASTL